MEGGASPPRVSWIRSFERKLQWRKRMREKEGGHEIEGEKKGEKLNFEVSLISFTFIKVVTSVTNISIYSLGH